MYIPKHFAIQDEEMKYEIIEQNSFATLFSQHNGDHMQRIYRCY